MGFREWQEGCVENREDERVYFWCGKLANSRTLNKNKVCVSTNQGSNGGVVCLDEIHRAH